MKLEDIICWSQRDVDKRRPLPWIADPTVSESDVLLVRRGSEHGDEAHGPLNYPLDGGEKRTTAFPGFKKRHTADPIELFYDLFFVANLGSFTSSHEINNVSNLKSYVGFISLMWFVWLQTTLFDIRFNTDSVLSRTFKAFHLGIMVAFAILAPNFDTSNLEQHPERFRDMSLVLMATRIVLILQYATVAWYVRVWKHTLVAKTAVMAILFGAAMVYLGLSFVFIRNPQVHGYVGWYVVSGVEAVLMIAISSFWKVLSFKNTAIVDRFAGMTLIVLGEGVVGMTKAATGIAQGTTKVTKSSIGLMIAYVLIVYFIYMMYFDQLDEERFGTIRQQLWALLHYPLHIAILLTIEGCRAFVLFDTGRRLVDRAAHKAAAILEAAETPSDIVRGLKEMVAYVSRRLATKDGMPDFQANYDQILSLNMSDPNDEKIYNSVFKDYVAKLDLWIMGTLGVVPDSPGEDYKVSDEKLAKKGYVIFNFFFIASGVTLISLAVLHWFGKSRKSRGELLSIVITAAIGISLALVSLISKTSKSNDEKSAYYKFTQSSWVEPLVLLTYALVLAIDGFIIWFSYRRQYKRVT
ncbi:hypothetical protein VTO42DRAFT_6847 [Malbranchea cinnamomea]